MKENGIGIIYISHRMAEIFKISDRISVVKDGNLLPTQASSETNIQQIAELMSRGGTPTSVATGAKAATYDNDRPALRITGLRTARKLRRGIDPEIAKGEILGLAGLVGCGRTTLAKALFGLLPDAVGSVEIDGKPLKLGSPTRAIAAGLGFVPEDRRREGLVIDHGIAINIALPSLMKLRVSNGRFPILMPNSADGLFDHMRSQLKIVCRAGRQHARELSGGNQQKVVVAKWLATNARLLILDEPTAGVDVNAKANTALAHYSRRSVQGNGRVVDRVGDGRVDTGRRQDRHYGRRHSRPDPAERCDRRKRCASLFATQRPGEWPCC